MNEVFAQALSLLLQNQAQPVGHFLPPTQSLTLSLPSPGMQHSLLSHQNVTQSHQHVTQSHQNVTPLQAPFFSVSSRPPVIGFPSGSFQSTVPLPAQAKQTTAASAELTAQLKAVAEQISRLQALQSGRTGAVGAGGETEGSRPGIHNLALSSMGQSLAKSSPNPPFQLGQIVFPSVSSCSSMSGDSDTLASTLGPHPAPPALDCDSSKTSRSSKKARKIFPRRKTGEEQRKHHDGVTLNAFVLAEYFDMPLMEASKRLGICQTTLKKTCRKFGIRKWPYKTRRLESPPNIGVRPETSSS